MHMIARVIIQMMGGPQKHLESTMKQYINKIEEEYADIKVKTRFMSHAKKEGSIFKLFAELELDIDGPENLVWFCFDYMPSSVEIVEPDRLEYRARDFTNFLNDLQQKLHKVDMALKNLSAENQVLKKNGTTLLKNILQLQLRSGPKDGATLAKNTGVPEDHIEKFLESMMKDGTIKKGKGGYSLP